MSKKTRNILITAIVLLASSGFLFGIILYQINDQEKALQEKILTIEEQNRQEASLNKLKRIFEESKEERSEIESKFLLNENNSIYFPTYIENLATEAGVVLNITNLETINLAESSQQWLQVDFEFSGERQPVQDFVKILENIPYVTRVINLDLDARSSTNWAATVQLWVMINET